MSKGQKPDQAAMLREYVHRALTNKAKGGDATSYVNLVKELTALRKKAGRDTSDLPTQHLLANMINALKDCVSALREHKHDALLNEVLSIKLWGSHQIVCEAVLEFICNLVVANAAFTHTCLQLLVYSFLPPPKPPKPGAEEGEWKMSEEAAVVQAAVLSALEKVMQMVPTAPTKLLQLICQHMPHKLRTRDTQCMYMSAMLGLAEVRAGAPIREGLLAAAVEHLLSIDVEIRWEDIVEAPTGQEAEEGPSEDEEEQEDIFELEGMSELDINCTPEEAARRQRQHAEADRGGWEGAAASAVASTSGRPAVDETANKLDSLMELMFGHLARRQSSGHSSDDLWPSLLSIFERTILHTHRSKFTQYLVFYLCSTQPTCASAFVDLLLSRLGDSRQPAITRSACAAYTASFLARAAFVPPAVVVNSLQRLIRLCQQYADAAPVSSPTGKAAAAAPAPGAAAGPQPPLQRSKSETGLDIDVSMSALHQVFYAGVQSALYILCYTLRTLMADASVEGARIATAVRQLVQQQLVPVLNHRLAPLLVCLPSVVSEFKHQAAALGLLDLSTLTSGGTEADRAQRPLEMFFPFDPYLLKRSSKHLQLKESYVRWRHGHPRTHAAAAAGAAAGAAAAAAEAGTAAGDSDDGDSEEEQEEVEADAMEGASNDDASSDEELEGMSVPSDSILPRPGLPAQGGMRATPSKASAATGGAPLHGTAAMLGLHGGGFRGKRGSGADDMAMSYSPGHMSGMGDGTPTGTSPVLVNYISPCGTSPGGTMQMTPPMHHHLMEQAHGSRLAQR